MKERKTISKFICLMMVVLFCITACGDEDTSSRPGGTSKTNSVSQPEYNYEEFVNKEEPDTDILETNSMSQNDAEKIEKERTKVREKILKFEKKYRNSIGITAENVGVYLEELQLYFLDEPINDITFWEIGDTSIKISLRSGVDYIYQPEISGYDLSGEQMEIATYQPGVSSFSKNLSQYVSYPDAAAKEIADEFEMYHFDSRASSDDRDYNDEEVTPETVLGFSSNNIVFWHGHGVYDKKYGCGLMLSIKVTTSSIRKYGKQINEGTIVICNDQLVITPSFIDTYFAENSLKNSIIYLGTCYSGADNSLIDALINKGAKAVFANSGKISTAYNTSMMKSIADVLIQKTGDAYKTLEEALEYAKEVNGETDKNGTEVRLYGYSDVSLDWYEDYKTAERDVVLVLDCSGSMRGTPMEQTKKAAREFIDTVTEQDSRISLVSYDSDACIECPMTYDKEHLKNSVENISEGGATNIYEGMSNAEQLLSNSKAKKKIIVLMTDGMPNRGETLNGKYEDALVEYADQLKGEGYNIYTLGFFSEMDNEEIAQAQEMLEKMADPGYHYEANSDGGLVQFLNDIANQIGGKQFVHIRIACPVNVTVSHDGEELSSEPETENTRTSFGSLSYEVGEDEDPVKILRLDMEKDYDVNLQGYSDGKMTYTVSYPNSSGEYTDVRKFPDIDVTESMRALSSTENADASYLEIDKNGDGKYETKYKTASNGTMEEVQDNTVLYVIIGIIVLVVIVTIVIIALVVRKSKSNKQGNQYAQTSAGTITVMTGNTQGKRYLVQVGVMYVIGRSSSCQIQLQHTRISRLHCKIRLLPNGLYQVADYSSNGTWCNNQRMEKGKVYTIQTGALLAVGSSDVVLMIQ